MASGSKRSVETARTAPPAGGATPSALTPAASRRSLVIGICLFLAILVWVVFGQTRHHEFVNFDDDRYVYDNPAVRNGLAGDAIVQAFTRSHGANWHPLTTLSHQLDCQLYGLSAGGHHLTSVALHAVTAMLLFLVLRRMTGSLWSSALVAAVFAVHPLRVESVAWVSERKDVLSGLFFMLTLGAYVRYVEHPRSIARYLLTVFLFALGLMCKPMLVSLPFVLLLLDYWPLNRVRGVRCQVSGEERCDNDLPPLTSHLSPLTSHVTLPLRHLLVEKIPFLVLSVMIGIVTLVVQSRSHAIQTDGSVSLSLRLGNALVSGATYLWQMIYPKGLAVLYPFPVQGVPAGEIMIALLVGSMVTAAVVLRRRQQPYLLVGWFWYLGMLLPVIGLIQVGFQARADRYTYLPQIGLYLLLTWTVAELSARRPPLRWLAGVGAVTVLAVLVVGARAQTAYWRDSESLWSHTLECTSANALAENNLGNARLDRGRVDDAIVCYRKALDLDPHNALAHYNLGNALFQQDRLDDAVAQFEAALRSVPDYADAHLNLANALLRMGRTDEAVGHYRQAAALQPELPRSHYNLGNALLQAGQRDEAVACYLKALALQPGFAEAQNNLGTALLQQGQLDAAAGHFQTALQLNPAYAEAHNNLGWILLQQQRVNEALPHFKEAVAIQPDYIAAYGNLAAACAAAGQFPEAIATVQRALPLAAARNNPAQVDALQAQLRAYQAGVSRLEPR